MITKEKKIIASIRQNIIESVHEILTDPDYNLSLKAGVVARMKKYSGGNIRGMKKLSEIKKALL